MLSVVSVSAPFVRENRQLDSIFVCLRFYFSLFYESTFCRFSSFKSSSAHSTSASLLVFVFFLTNYKTQHYCKNSFLLRGYNYGKL